VNGYELFYYLFLSLDLWGYLGPLGLVLAGYALSQKDRMLGLVWFMVECLFIANYFTLIEATPDYWWHILIILLGGIIVLVPALMRQ